MTTVRELVVEVNIKGDAEEKSRGLFDGFADIKAGLDVLVAGVKVAGQAIASFTTEFVAAGDEIAKNAKNIGISAEALQELDFAAKRSGASAKEVQVAIQRMGLGLNDATTKGTGPFAEALEQLGIGVEQLQGLSPDETFIELSDAISRVKDPMDRAALAQKAFGRGGRTLLPLINEGREGIEALTGRARELGLAYSNDAAKATEDFADAQLDLETSLLSIKAAVAEGLLPVIQDIIVAITDWSVENKDLIEGEIREFVDELVAALRQLLPLVQDMAPVVKDFALGVAEVAAETAFLIEHFMELDDVLSDDLGPAWDIFKGLIEATLVPINLLIDNIDTLTSKTSKLGAAARGAAGPLALLVGRDEPGEGVRTTTKKEKAGFLGEGGGVTVIEGAERLSRAKSSSQLKAIADDDSERPAVRAVARERLLVKQAEDVAFVTQLTAGASDAGFVEQLTAASKRPDPTKGFRGKQKGGKKKDEKVTDEELLKLISKASAEGVGLDSVLKGRKLEGGAPPVISVQIENNDIKQSINAPITVTGVPGETAEDTAMRVESMLRDVLQSEFRDAIEELDTPVSR